MIANNKISVYNETNDGFADMLGYEGVWKPKGPISAEKDDNFYFKYLIKSFDKENYQRLPISSELSNIKNINNINEYFDYIVGKDCAVFIAVQDIQGYSMTSDIIEKIKALGFDDEINVLLNKKISQFYWCS